MPRLAEHCERLLELVALQEASIIRHVAKERELAEENEKLRRLVLQVTRENPMGEPANGQHKSII